MIILKTPSGKPAAIPNSPNFKAVNGVSSDGLSITEQPAARAAETLRVTIARGKFQGVIAATTPTGCLIKNIFLLLSGDSSNFPSDLRACSAAHSIKEAPYSTSTFDSANGLPDSKVISSASISLFFFVKENRFFKISDLYLALVLDQALKASLADCIDLFICFASALDTEDIFFFRQKDW